jgi:polysaccharide pyruvyl transferase WcaK-like protein
MQRFGLITPSGWGNLGDAAIQDAVIAYLRQRYPDCEIIAFSLNPEDTERRHGVPAYPISGISIIPGYWVRTERTKSALSQGSEDGTEQSAVTSTDEPGVKATLRRIPLVFSALRLLRRLLKPAENAARKVYGDFRHVLRSVALCRGATALIVSGGGQIDEYWGGAWGHPYTLLKWALISRLTGSDYVILGVGTGTVSSSVSRFFIRRALSMADSRSFRDQKSLEMARDYGAAKDDAVTPDLAFAMDISGYLGEKESAGAKRVVISPMCYCDPRIWPTRDAGIYEAYIRKLAEVCARLSDDGWRLVFVPSDTVDNMAIADCVDGLRRNRPNLSDNAIETPEIAGVADLLGAVGSSEAVIASRLHCVLLSFAIHKPVFSLSYDRKVQTLVEEVSQNEYCLEIETFVVDEVVERFKRMVERSDHVSKEIETHVAEFRKSLNRYFDSIFSA